MQMPFVVLFLNLGTGEILLIVMFVVMFFGTGKLPEIARALGKGMRQMKMQLPKFNVRLKLDPQKFREI